MLSRRAVKRSSLFAVVEVLQCSENPYLVPERKLGFFVKIKPPAHRAYAPEGKTKILTTGILVVFRGLKFESDADIGGKDSFRSGTI
jgi:hypothetical protein